MAIYGDLSCYCNSYIFSHYTPTMMYIVVHEFHITAWGTSSSQMTHSYHHWSAYRGPYLDLLSTLTVLFIATFQPCYKCLFQRLLAKLCIFYLLPFTNCCSFLFPICLCLTGTKVVSYFLLICPELAKAAIKKN